MISAKVTVQLM